MTLDLRGTEHIVKQAALDALAATSRLAPEQRDLVADAMTTRTVRGLVDAGLVDRRHYGRAIFEQELRRWLAEPAATRGRFQTSRVAERCGVTPRAVRYWKKAEMAALGLPLRARH